MNAFEELLQKIETAAKGIAGHYDDRVRIAAADIREAVSEAAAAVGALEGKEDAAPAPSEPAAPALTLTPSAPVPIPTATASSSV